MKLTVLIRDLRRRKVFRGAGFYVIGAWAMLQVADVIVEPAGLPPWSLTALLYLSVLLFPVAVFLSWRYEWSDEALIRTMPYTREGATDTSLQRLDYAIFVVLAVVVSVVIWRVLPDSQPEASEQLDQAEQVADQNKNSIAVLPFKYLSADPTQSFLADGISDTVLHMLSKVENLLVTARTSSFYYRTSYYRSTPLPGSCMLPASSRAASRSSVHGYVLSRAWLSPLAALEIWSQKISTAS